MDRLAGVPSDGAMTTNPTLPVLLTVAATVGSGTVGGVFGAFSGFVLPALGRLDPPAATAAMQAVDVAAVRPPLMTALFGTAALAVAAPVAAARQGAAGTGLLLAAGALYLVGVVGVTVAGNVPLNDALARTDAAAATRASWTAWSRAWARRNHVRTAAGTAAAVLYAVSLGS